MLKITRHAHQRFLERFPDVPVCLTDRVQKAIPIGHITKKRKFLYDYDHKIVFVLVKDESDDLVLVTLLTYDQYLSDYARRRDLQMWRNGPINPSAPVVQNETKPEKEVEQKSVSEAEIFLKNLAKTSVVEYGFIYPEISKAKEITATIKTNHKFSNKQIEKYFWPEIGRLIYEHNARYREVVKDAE